MEAQLRPRSTKPDIVDEIMGEKTTDHLDSNHPTLQLTRCDESTSLKLRLYKGYSTQLLSSISLLPLTTIGRPAMVILLLALIFLAGAAFLLFTFLTAYGDFTLMSKKHVKPHAFEDKVVWVTGASRGIGEELAKQLAGLGAKLILSARNEAELERVKENLKGKYAPAQVQVLPLDLTAGEAILKDVVEKAESFFSGAGVDFMIHNAAYERPKSSALDMSEEGLQGMLDVNVRGTLSLTRLLAPYMVKRGSGHFIVMSSAAGKTPSPGQAVYSATKFALNGYFHALRSELCQKGIKVTIVCPGPIRTTEGRSEKYLSSPRCAELTLIAASHGLKEAWISNQPVLVMMYLMQYMPTLGLYVIDQVGPKRVEAAAQKGDTYSMGLLFGKTKSP